VTEWVLKRLDYLQWARHRLICCRTLYDSPWRDGGYDIRECYKVRPESVTVDEFVALLKTRRTSGNPGQHRLVMEPTPPNRTVFQESRHDPTPLWRLRRVERNQ